MTLPTEEVLTFDLGALVRALGGDASDGWEWLEGSYSQPDAFHAVLWERANRATETPLASELGVKYDFFQALCARFANSLKPLCALSWPRPGQRWLETDYALLGSHATRTHAYWRTRKLKPGQSLCVVGEPSPEYAVAVLAALRMGLIVSCVSPAGPSFVWNRVAALAPDHIVVDAQFLPWLGELADRALPLSEPDLRLPSVVPDSFVYDAKMPVLRLFSPYAPESLAPLTLSAHELFMGLLRDAHLIWPVRRGDKVAAPGCDPTLAQPTMMLTTWLGGGEWLLLDPELLASGRTKLSERSPTVLFVDRRTRDLLRGPGELEGLSIARWFRDPAEPSDAAPWDELATLLARKGARGANILQAAAAGGSLLFSEKSQAPGLFDVRPSPGRPWLLEDLNGSGEEAVGSTGLYTLLGECGDGRAGRFVLSAWDEGFRLSGALDSWRAGVVYPALEVHQLLSERANADAAAVVMMPSSAHLHEVDALLQVFVDPRWADALGQREKSWSSEIRDLIERELGAWALPDRISILPLLPEHDESGQVDPSWVRRQVLGNVLVHKARRPVFVELAALSRILERLTLQLGASPKDPTQRREGALS